MWNYTHHILVRTISTGAQAAGEGSWSTVREAEALLGSFRSVFRKRV
jgi:hypothetical protein